MSFAWSPGNANPNLALIRRLPMLTTRTVRTPTTNPADNIEMKRFPFRKGVPLGFEAGDANLYRYVANNPTNNDDPSGLVNGTISHCYPLHLGGSNFQPAVELASVDAHNAFHNYLGRFGFNV